MISPRISFKNFKSKKVKSSLVRKKLTTLIKEKNEILKSLSKDYKTQDWPHKSCCSATAGERGASKGLESAQGKNDSRGGAASD